METQLSLVTSSKRMNLMDHQSGNSIYEDPKQSIRRTSDHLDELDE